MATVTVAKQAKTASAMDTYYAAKIEELEVEVREKMLNLRRLEAQRNELNSKVRLLREELSLLQEPGSYVGEVVKVMGRKKVLVKVRAGAIARGLSCWGAQRWWRRRARRTSSLTPPRSRRRCTPRASTWSTSTRRSTSPS